VRLQITWAAPLVLVLVMPRPAGAFELSGGCGITFVCGRVAGVALGGHAQADVYFAGPLGISVSASVDWSGGRSRLVPEGVAVMVVAGPVVRWRPK
jgi:hypothetical protein